jgi:hypothetical protein
VRAVYAPALVGWVGPPGVSVSLNFGGGGVAWFPLGPREVYVPARRFSPRYVERVNVTNTVIVNRTYINNVYNNRVTNVTYRNRTVPGAVTSVSRTTFTSAERVGNHRVRFDEQQFAHAGATAMAPQIQPGRESRLGVGEMARRTVRMPPQTVANRQVVVKREPPPAAAHFARNAGTNNVPRPQVDQPRRPQDHAERNGATANQNRPVNTNVHADANREAAPAAERARDERGVRDAQNARADRPPQARSNVEHSPRTEQPRVDAAPRAVQTPPVQHTAPDRPREDRPPQHQRQEHQEQQPRQAELPQQQQERAAGRERQQGAAAQQVQQHQRDAERPHAERPQPEHQNRPEPQKPAENKSQPQKQQEHKERRPEQDDQKT